MFRSVSVLLLVMGLVASCASRDGTSASGTIAEPTALSNQSPVGAGLIRLF